MKGFSMRNPEDHLKLLEELVEIKSYSGKEKQLRAYLESWFADRGIETFVQGENLVVHLQGKDPSRAFIMNSHMDTVSAGDLAQWQSNPWTLTVDGDKAFGLGASDMKAGLAASMLMAERFYQQGTPATDMWFTYVVMEEVDGAGTVSFADWFEQQGYLDQYQDSASIFTEPTALAAIEHGHRGNIFLKVTIPGDSGHGSRPWLITNHAVRSMIDFSDLLQAAIRHWREEFDETDFEPPTVGDLTSIQAGLAPVVQDGETVIAPESVNKFPNICIATFDLRTVPGFHEVALQRIQELGERFGATIEPFTMPAPAGYTNPQEKLVQVAMAVLSQQGTEPELRVSQGAADLGFLTAKGIKSVILGPGVKEVIHQANEYCHLSEIPIATNVYQAIAEGWAATEN